MPLYHNLPSPGLVILFFIRGLCTHAKTPSPPNASHQLNTAYMSPCPPPKSPVTCTLARSWPASGTMERRLACSPSLCTSVELLFSTSLFDLLHKTLLKDRVHPKQSRRARPEGGHSIVHPVNALTSRGLCSRPRAAGPAGTQFKASPSPTTPPPSPPRRCARTGAPGGCSSEAGAGVAGVACTAAHVHM